MLRVKNRTPHARQSSMKDPPNTSGLCADSQISCGTLDVSDDSAAPIPNVIITAGSVQHTSVDRLVISATVGAAVSRRANLLARIFKAYQQE